MPPARPRASQVLPPASIERPTILSPISSLRARTSHLPYSSHPLFVLRKTTIIISILGAFLFLFGTNYWYWPQGLYLSLFALPLSALFCAWDVHKYAKKKAECSEGEEPKWPEKKIMFVDLGLAVGLHFVFWVAVSTVRFNWYDDAVALMSAWGCLADLLVSFLHAYCFWKQLMARYKMKWLSTLPHGPCPRCGFHESEADVVQGRITTCLVAQSQPAEAPATPSANSNLFTYVGPAADCSHADDFTPSSQDSTMEEGY